MEQEYLTVTDGALVDDFDGLHAQSKEYIVNKNMRATAKDGWVIIFNGWPRRYRKDILSVLKIRIYDPCTSIRSLFIDSIKLP